MKTLDMADKYEPASYSDDEPTVKVNMQAILPKVYLEDDEPTLPSMRNPLLPKEEKRYPGIGLLLAFGSGAIFWGTLLYFIFR